MPAWARVTTSTALALSAFIAAAAVNPACLLLFVAGAIFGLISYSSGPFWKEMYEDATKRGDGHFDSYVKEMRLRIQAEARAAKAEARLDEIQTILTPEGE